MNKVLHAKELQRRYGRKGGKNRVIALSVCPGWVATNILTNDVMGNFVRHHAFTMSAGALAPICALLDNSIPGGSYVSNFHNYIMAQSWSNSFIKMLSYFNIRDSVTDMLGLWVLMTQGMTYGCNIETSSPESYNETLAMTLYEWSDSAVQSYS